MIAVILPITVENYAMVFHTNGSDCPGMIVGTLDTLHCAECKARFTLGDCYQMALCYPDVLEAITEFEAVLR
jgi:hypothetical protein